VCKFIKFRQNMTCLKYDCKHLKDEHTHNSMQGWNDYLNDVMGDFHESKYLAYKFKNLVKTTNPSKAQNDEYDHGSISDDELLHSAKRKGLGIYDRNFDVDDITRHGGKSGTTIGRRKEWSEKKSCSQWNLGMDKRLSSSNAKESNFLDLYLDDEDDNDVVDSNWNKETSGRVFERYGRDSTIARGKERVHNYDDLFDKKNEGEIYGKSKVGKAEGNKARNGVTRSR